MNKSKAFSIITLIIVILVLISVRATHPLKKSIGWDFYGYYLYLPAMFKYDDPGLEDRSWVEENNAKYNNTPYFYQFYQNEKTGRTLIKYPVGQAIAYAPFYFIADTIAKNSERYPADGFSKPYILLTVIAGMFYTLIGLLLMYLLLIRLLPKNIAAVSLLIIAFGTNYFWMAGYHGELIHNVQLAWIAAFMLFCIRWFEKFRSKDAFLLGLFYGLAVTTRPTAILLILIPLFWNVYSLKALRERIQFIIQKKYRHLLLLIAGFLIFTSVQMLYWKYTTGSFIAYTYQNAGEGFELHWPYTLKYLFSARKGWLIYTPVMIFALAGIFTLRKTHKQLFPALLIFSIAYIWLLSSWSCWWYAASLSQRSIIQAYPIFGIGLGSFLVFINAKKSRWLFYLLILVFSGLSMLYTWQYRNGILHMNRMNADYLFHVFGKTEKPEGVDSLLLIERNNNGQHIIAERNLDPPEQIHFNDFEAEQKSELLDSTHSFSGNYAVRLDTAKRFSPKFQIPYKEITDNYYAVMKVEAMIYPLDTLLDSDLLIVCLFKHKGDAYFYRTSESNSTGKKYLPGQWQNIEYYYVTPHVRRKNNRFETYLWNKAGKPVLIDNFKVEKYTE